MEYENNYASKAVGTAGLTTGIIGTALGTLGSGILGNGLIGGNNQYVSKEVYDVQLQLIEANKNNAILSADLNTEKKMVEVFNGAINRVNAVRDELMERIAKVEKTVSDNASAQAVINCGFQSNIGILQNQMHQLFGMTKLVIPNDSVSPGWGDIP